MTFFDLRAFSSDSEISESEGEVILEALLNSSISTIQHLNLSSNKKWFESEEVVELMMDVIGKQA